MPPGRPARWVPISVPPRRWQPCAGKVLAGGSRAVVAAHGEVLPAALAAAGRLNSVLVGPLPRLLDVAAAAARRPAYVVVLADRDGAAVVMHAAGDEHPAGQFRVGLRPGAQRETHAGRPPHSCTGSGT